MQAWIIELCPIVTKSFIIQGVLGLISTPSSSYKALATEYEFDEFCKKSRVAIVQPDLTRCGGFITMKKIENIAINNGCELVPHGFSTQILLHATAQFLASSKTCNLIEYSKSTSSLFNICNPLPCEDGVVKISDCVGLGITLNEEIINKYKID